MKIKNITIIRIFILGLITTVFGILKDYIIEITASSDFIKKYNIDENTIITSSFIILALLIPISIIFDFLKEQEEHKIGQHHGEEENLTKDIRQKLNRRNILIEKISEEVNSRLEQSLHNRVYVVLNKEKDSSQIETPWEIDVKVAHKPKTRLKNTEIITVFDREEIAGKLLILGEPGSGKTTMLLKLAEKLVERAKQDFHQPVPLLFSLPTWKDDKQSIKEWLIEQLKDKYGIRKDIGKQWLENQEIIPLLDGLDELAVERQEECVKRINDFLKPGTWGNPLVICSRTQEYQHYQTLLQLNSSLELCPYTPQQVYKYLRDAGNEELWNSINNDADLSNLARTPLLLNIIVISAQEILVEKWQQFQSTDERLNYLLDAYISRMFKRHYKNKQPPQEKTKRWLSWLAQRLVEEDSTEFFIEKMQPHWLKNRLQIIIYNLIVWGVIEGIIMGLTLGLIYKLIYGLISGVNYGLAYKLFRGISRIFGISEFFSFPEFFRLIYGLVYGITIGSVIGVANGLFGEQIEKNIEKIVIQISPLRSISKVLVKWQIYGLIGSLATGLIFWLTSNVYKLSELTEFSGIYGLNFIIIYALISGLLYGSISGFIGDNIQTMESLKFRIKTYFYGLTTGLILGLILGLVFGVIYGITYGITYGLIYGTMIGMTIGILFGIDGIEIENKQTSNQGIRQSFTNTLAISINTCLFTIPVNFIILTIAFKDREILVTSLMSGIFLGLLIGITRCGTPVIKHFVLRVVLWSNGYIPWNYAKFLDYCTNRLFLQRVGGSYRFMHDLLRQHFAKKYAELYESGENSSI